MIHTVHNNLIRLRTIEIARDVSYSVRSYFFIMLFLKLHVFLNKKAYGKNIYHCSEGLLTVRA